MKKIIPICLLLLTVYPSQWVGAHAVITDYSLKITPIRANSAAQVELSFNSKIELGLSQIFLVSIGDKHTLLQADNGSKQGQIIIHVPPLEAGDYALRFKVFAADGHLTEDVIHFSVSE
ncbi:MAG: copper resistance protein CopC [Methylobacter sp.]|nr:copper resistance protein CopC [Methylobacter sp.]MDP2097286.1 copper resistance protein CopC [Methylobacter sp.]MDP2428460.1 copper resistance protein CopC [Methylobacter sp.]MDP3053441.1 copper resistance protein CopC [Methylobacter sp.]MDP3361639.1 copper resistance protein CopC [Methylobacter sp.]